LNIVDIVFDKNTEKHLFFEVNRSPQIEASSFTDQKAQEINSYFMREMDLNLSKKAGKTIGRVENISFPELGVENIPARVDTGAKLSSLWASDIEQHPDGTLSFNLFNSSSPLFSGQKVTVSNFSEIVISSSMGIAQRRYKVKLLTKLHGRKIRASFTLADRSTQVYPVLVGRNILHGKFVVDVKHGKPLLEAERKRRKQLDELID